MVDNPIRAALEAAAEAMIMAAPDVARGQRPERNAASSVIVAFLRALPDNEIASRHLLSVLADAVERCDG